MKKILLPVLPVIYSCLAFVLSAQNPAILWEKTIPGTSLDVRTAVMDPAGERLDIAGLSTDGHTEVLSLDLKGNLLQQEKVEFLSGIKTTALNWIYPGQLAFAGKKEGADVVGQFNVPSKTLLHQAILAPAFEADLQGIAVNQSGSYILGGSAKKDVLVLQAGKNGRVEWSKSFGSPAGRDGIFSILPSSGGYLLSGYGDDYNSQDYFAALYQIDATGRNVWERKFGDFTTATVATAAAIDEKGRILYAGVKGGRMDLVLLNSQQEVIWGQSLDCDSDLILPRTLLYAGKDRVFLLANNLKAEVIIMEISLSGADTYKPVPATQFKLHLMDPEGQALVCSLKNGFYVLEDTAGTILQMGIEDLAVGYFYCYGMDKNRKVHTLYEGTLPNNTLELPLRKAQGDKEPVTRYIIGFYSSVPLTSAPAWAAKAASAVHPSQILGPGLDAKMLIPEKVAYLNEIPGFSHTADGHIRPLLIEWRQ